MLTNPGRMADAGAAARALAPVAAAIAAACAASIGLMLVAFEVGGLRSADGTSQQRTEWPPATPEAAAAQPQALLGLALEQVYRAFGETDETAIYDALARVAADEALESLYLQRRGALVNAAFDGGSQRVDHVEVIAADATVERGRVAIDGRWRVIGAVGHENHQHIRGAAYAARLGFALTPEGWRMVDFDLRDVDREAVGESLDP